MTTADEREAIEYDAFFREWYPRLVSLGVAMTGRRDVARDAAQEGLLRAHRHWDAVGTYRAPGAWVRKVTVNVLIDHLRGARAERTAVARLGARASRDRPPDGEPVLDRWSQLVAGLPARQRAIVTLFYADDQSVQAIADTLGLSPGTVKAQLFTARQVLRTRLADDGAEEIR